VIVSDFKRKDQRSMQELISGDKISPLMFHCYQGESRRKERTYSNIEVTDGRSSFLTGAKATKISMKDLSEGDVVIA
jgi:hypothetical protein